MHFTSQRLLLAIQACYHYGDLIKFFWLCAPELFHLKGQVQCFSMQVVMNKCFLLNPEKNGADPSCREKCKYTHFHSEKWRYRAEG